MYVTLSCSCTLGYIWFLFCISSCNVVLVILFHRSCIMFLIAINTLCTLAVADKFTVHINCLSFTAIKRADMTLVHYSKKSISYYFCDSFFLLNARNLLPQINNNSNNISFNSWRYILATLFLHLWLKEKDFPGISYMKMIIIIKSIRLFKVRTKNFMQAIKV